MSIDLEGIRGFIEDDIMIDTCVVTRDAGGNTERRWDPEIGAYEGEDDPLPVIYSGKCYVSSTGTLPTEDTEGALQIVHEWYYLNIPMSAPSLTENDYVEVTASVRNPHLVGEEFKVQADLIGTNKVKQKVRIRRATHKRLR